MEAFLYNLDEELNTWLMKRRVRTTPRILRPFYESVTSVFEILTEENQIGVEREILNFLRTTVFCFRVLFSLFSMTPLGNAKKLVLSRCCLLLPTKVKLRL